MLTNIPVIPALDVMTNTTQAFSHAVCAGNHRDLRQHPVRDRQFLFATLKTTDSMGHFGNTVITATTGSTTEPGLAAGGGFEYAFTNNLSAKFEYLYVSVKSVQTTIPATAGNLDSIVVNHDFSDHIGRFGLNFKLFGG
jgi:opacity protein-like surface antigen